MHINLFKITVFTTLLFLGLQAQAQEQPNGNSWLSAAYFGHGAIRAGAKVSYGFHLFKNKPGNGVYLSPQIAVFGRPKFYTGHLLNAEIGWQRPNSNKRWQQSFSAGLGYLYQRDWLSYTVNLKGDISDVEYSNKSFFLGTINYQLLYNMAGNFDPFVKGSYGKRFSGNWGSAGQLFVELGIRYTLKNNEA